MIDGAILKRLCIPICSYPPLWAGVLLYDSVYTRDRQAAGGGNCDTKRSGSRDIFAHEW